VLTANRAANKSESCQNKNDIIHPDSGSSEITVILLSLLVTMSFIAFIIIIACLMTRHQRQLTAIRYEKHLMLIYLMAFAFVVIIYL